MDVKILRSPSEKESNDTENKLESPESKSFHTSV